MVESAKPTRGSPSTPNTGVGLPANAPDPPLRPESSAMAPRLAVFRGAPMRTAKNMDTSLSVSTATSVHSVPMKLVIDQRTGINSFPKTSKGGRVSSTRLITYAVIQVLKAVPAMNNSYDVISGKPTLIEDPVISPGVAIDLKEPDGTHQFLVPSIRGCEKLDFVQLWADYERTATKARAGELAVADFAGTTATITNPEDIGMNHSVPRLMNGQGMALSVGNIDYLAKFQGTSLFHIDDFDISRITTLTFTYDHRVIQDVQSGEFLKIVHQLLPGEQGFYNKIFEALRIPYGPLRWSVDISTHRENQATRQGRMLELINTYHSVGHLVADTDPLEYRQRPHENLRLEIHGLSIWDPDRRFAAGSFGGQERVYHSLQGILVILQDSYCRIVAAEYMHIADPQRRKRFQDRIEAPHQVLTYQERMHALNKLNEAEVFEIFPQTKFAEQKRFSLEGGEFVIVPLDEICQRAANEQLNEVYIGMPYCGRLNVMSSIVGKDYTQIFHEFAGTINVSGTGDVKYHLGSEDELVANSRATIKASAVADPSHLEAIGPAPQEITRIKQGMIGGDNFPVLPLLLYSNAVFYSQGVIFEALQMNQLHGYKTSGAIHIMVNNQVRFTMAPIKSRTSTCCTDVVKVVFAPVLHISGDGPDSYIWVARPALTCRQQFREDVAIDLVYYRRRDYNEGDDPSFTQPKIHDLIERKRSARRLYAEALIGRGNVSVFDTEDVIDKFRVRLESMFRGTRDVEDTDAVIRECTRVPYYPARRGHRLTEITPEMLHRISEVHARLPEGFAPHPKVLLQLKRRVDQILNDLIDRAAAELLTIGSLLMEGRPVQLTGQDSRRGTFSQRSMAIVGRITNEAWVPLRYLNDDQATFDVCGSLLSEHAAMGFEYDYSIARPNALVLQEAQFGGFANGAQIIADEFVISGRTKWSQKSGVVLLLSHGFEGQGPDHSSARIERWLQLCVENILAVNQPLTAASYFHLLRQHAYASYHRPVVMATPKSMLRSEAVASLPEELAPGAWHPVLDDPTITDPPEIIRLLICSGKIRWELVTSREKPGPDGKVAIISLERLYPLPEVGIARVLGRYRYVTDIRFAQDEPINRGP